MKYRQRSLLPGTGRCWNDPTTGSGYRRLVLKVDVLDVSTNALTPANVHVLAQGRSQTGSLAFDRKSGSPLTVYDEITTPSLLFYDLAPDVASLDVQGSLAGLPDETLAFEARLDGQIYPLPQPEINRGLRAIWAHLVIDILGLVKKS